MEHFDDKVNLCWITSRHFNSQHLLFKSFSLSQMSLHCLLAQGALLVYSKAEKARQEKRLKVTRPIRVSFFARRSTCKTNASYCDLLGVGAARSNESERREQGHAEERAQKVFARCLRSLESWIFMGVGNEIILAGALKNYCTRELGEKIIAKVLLRFSWLCARGLETCPPHVPICIKLWMGGYMPAVHNSTHLAFFCAVVKSLNKVRTLQRWCWLWLHLKLIVELVASH